VAGIAATGAAGAATSASGLDTGEAAACCVLDAANGDIALIWSVSSGLTNITPIAPIALTPATSTVR
jgi:hypothetical protein